MVHHFKVFDSNLEEYILKVAFVQLQGSSALDDYDITALHITSEKAFQVSMRREMMLSTLL